MKDEYTFDPKFSNLESVPTYSERNGYFGFPRHSGIKVQEIDDQMVEGGHASVRFLGDLRDSQVPVLLQFQELVERGKHDLILEADTGSGKTIMLLKMWSMISRPALVVVPKTDLVGQWRKRILEFTDIPASRIGLAQQNVCEYEGKSIVIGMIHSLCRDKYPEEFKRHFGLIIFDELHKLGAFYFSRVGGMFPAKYRIGATATLKRSDGLERAFYVHLGGTIMRPEVSEQPVPKVAIYNYKESSGKIPYYLSEVIARRGVLLSKLAKNDNRSRIIAQLAAQLVGSERQVLIVSERIPHLEKIGKMLQQIGIRKEDIGFYLGKTKKAERVRVAKECRCILATTSMLSLGTDIPTLRGLVFATPVSQVIQPVGRIRRINPELLVPFVIDIYDSFYEECTRWMRNRRRFYESIDCDINFIDG